MAGDTRKQKRSAAEQQPGGDPDTAEQKKDRLAKYNAVVDRAELASISLIEVNFKVRPEHFADGERSPAGKLRYGIAVEEASFNAETGCGGVFLDCEAASRKGRKNSVQCKAKYFVGYRNMVGCDEAAAKAFMSRVGRFTCYPYFRSLLATLNWSADTQLPALPVLREPVPGYRKPSD
jgi:hypothetical protein